MKPYLATFRVPFFGVIILIIGSVILGIGIGIAAHFVSTLIYFFFVFSLFVGLLSMIPFSKLLLFAKVHHPLVTTLMGLITGLLIAIAFYATPYFILRQDFIRDAKQNYQVSTARASAAFDQILVDETNSSGLWGYMKFRAKEGDQFTNYWVINGVPIHESILTMRSIWAWLYWLIETLLFALPVAWIGFDIGKLAFSESANDWYNAPIKQIFAVPLENKELLLTLLRDGNLQEISEMAVSEEKISHPMLEVYTQRSGNKKGDILLSIKQTYLDRQEKIKRNVVGQWEVSEPNYLPFVNTVKHKLAE